MCQWSKNAYTVTNRGQMDATHLYCSESQWVFGLVLSQILVDSQLPLAAVILLR